nr:hypothetical protein [Pseudomonas aeruginosa]
MGIPQTILIVAAMTYLLSSYRSDGLTTSVNVRRRACWVGALMLLLLAGGFFSSAKADEIPRAAEQYRRVLVRAAHAEWGAVGADRYVRCSSASGEPLAC